jgi:hypothetical protein
MMNRVVAFNRTWAHENDEAIAELTELHNSGDILGLAYIAIGRNGIHTVRASGQAVTHPEIVIGLAMRMMWALIADKECTCRNR